MGNLPDLSRFEFECLKKLWARGEGTVRDVHGDLADAPSYSTVRKIFERLENKQAVERVRRTGKAWVYHSRVSATAMIGKEIRRVLDAVFDGSAESLVAHLAETDAVSLRDLREIEKRLEKKSKKSKKPKKRKKKKGSAK